MRHRAGLAIVLALVMGGTGAAGAEGGAATDGAATRAGSAEAPGTPAPCLAERGSLTDDWWGCGPQWAEKGLTIDLGVTQVYALNARGGQATHRHAGRWAGSYDLEIGGDAERLLGLGGGSFTILAEGSWSEGIDASSVGSLMGLNDDAGGDRSIDVTELWYEQALADGKVRVRLGKVDLTGGFDCEGCPVAFDGNAYANDETGQFLASPLVNNPGIPFPDNGIGLVVYVQPRPGWYVAAGIADAQADARETGFNTAFDREDYTFSTFETGVSGRIASAGGPLPGACRVGMWYDPQPKDFLDGTDTKRDDVGLYLSAEQMVLRERPDPDDTQGLGVFVRFGCADPRVNEIRTFWSLGCRYRGLVPGRDEDVLGVAMARARTSGDAGFTAKHETLLEAYYAIRAAPWLSVSPHVQYVRNPGGDNDARDAFVAGVRVQALLGSGGG